MKRREQKIMEVTMAVSSWYDDHEDDLTPLQIAAILFFLGTAIMVIERPADPVFDTLFRDVAAKRIPLDLVNRVTAIVYGLD